MKDLTIPVPDGFSQLSPTEQDDLLARIHDLIAQSIPAHNAASEQDLAAVRESHQQYRSGEARPADESFDRIRSAIIATKNKK